MPGRRCLQWFNPSPHRGPWIWSPELQANRHIFIPAGLKKIFFFSKNSGIVPHYWQSSWHHVTSRVHLESTWGPRSRVFWSQCLFLVLWLTLPGTDSWCLLSRNGKHLMTATHLLRRTWKFLSLHCPPWVWWRRRKKDCWKGFRFTR